MRRRRFLRALGLAGWRFWPRGGWLNPCRTGLPPELAGHELAVAGSDRQGYGNPLKLTVMADTPPQEMNIVRPDRSLPRNLRPKATSRFLLPLGEGGPKGRMRE